MDDRDALVMLNTAEGIAPARMQSFLKRLPSPSAFFGKRVSDLVAWGLSEATARALLALPEQFDVARERETARKEGVRIVTFLDAEYPKRLREIPDAPVVLYLKGALCPKEELFPESALFFGIVGSRRATAYGTEMAGHFARELAGCGFTVVSGLARGVDTASHRGTLKAGGRTVGVLGSGLHHLYPSENRRLADAITASGALVSEFPMNTPALPGHFPRRNRIISGLSAGVLVVEADEKSGALITAHAAMEQGREVFALPGRVDSPVSRGAHRLIQEGAKLVRDLADILEELKIPVTQDLSSRIASESPGVPEEAPLTGEETVVYEVLSDLPKSIDAIVEETRLSARETLASLTQLEVKQLVKAFPGKHYARVSRMGRS